MSIGDILAWPRPASPPTQKLKCASASAQAKQKSLPRQELGRVEVEEFRLSHQSIKESSIIKNSNKKQFNNIKKQRILKQQVPIIQLILVCLISCMQKFELTGAIGSYELQHYQLNGFYEPLKLLLEFSDDKNEQIFCERLALVLIHKQKSEQTESQDSTQSSQVVKKLTNIDIINYSFASGKKVENAVGKRVKNSAQANQLFKDALESLEQNDTNFRSLIDIQMHQKVLSCLAKRAGDDPEIGRLLADRQRHRVSRQEMTILTSPLRTFISSKQVPNEKKRIIFDTLPVKHQKLLVWLSNSSPKAVKRKFSLAPQIKHHQQHAKNKQNQNDDITNNEETNSCHKVKQCYVPKTFAQAQQNLPAIKTKQVCHEVLICEPSIGSGADTNNALTGSDGPPPNSPPDSPNPSSPETAKNEIRKILESKASYYSPPTSPNGILYKQPPSPPPTPSPSFHKKYQAKVKQQPAEQNVKVSSPKHQSSPDTTMDSLAPVETNNNDDQVKNLINDVMVFDSIRDAKERVSAKEKNDADTNATADKPKIISNSEFDDLGMMFGFRKPSSYIETSPWLDYIDDRPKMKTKSKSIIVQSNNKSQSPPQSPPQQQQPQQLQQSKQQKKEPIKQQPQQTQIEDPNLPSPIKEARLYFQIKMRSAANKKMPNVIKYVLNNSGFDQGSPSWCSATLELFQHDPENLDSTRDELATVISSLEGSEISEEEIGKVLGHFVSYPPSLDSMYIDIYRCIIKFKEKSPSVKALIERVEVDGFWNDLMDPRNVVGSTD